VFNSIAIVGSGALGSYYGARLAQHGGAVHFLMRSDYARVREHGLNIYSHDGDFKLSPEQIHVYDDVAKMPKVDLVIVTLKTTANDQFAKLIPPLLGDKTAILTLQNGLGNDEELATLFGGQRVLGGLAFICTNRTEAGVIHHTDHGFIKLGEYVPGASARAEALADLFRKSKVPSEAMADIRYGRWEKLVWNVPFNGLGTVMDLETDKLLASEAGTNLVRGLMHEIMATAAAIGVPLAADTAEKQIQRTATMGAYVSSMQVDRRQGRPLEHMAIVGHPLETARHAKVATPLLEILHQQLVTIDAANNK